jgi:phosphoribosylanthranilate isomerase
MTLWIKICGNTSLDDAQLAVDAGADAVGFVFAPSPRHITAEKAAEIAPILPSKVEKIGVFVDASFEEIESTVTTAGLTGVQLHSGSGADMPSRLKQRFGADFKVLRVVHYGPDAVTQAESIDGDPNIDAVLVDSRTAAAVGGTGIAFDWDAARDILFAQAQKSRVAAGGLTPANVAEAIAKLHPSGVDVVSGVEAAHGTKDPAKVREFIANARAAECR